MLILFKKRKGVKITTEIIFHEIQQGAGYSFIMGMIYYASKIGAITPAEETALIEYLQERGSR